MEKGNITSGGVVLAFPRVTAVGRVLSWLCSWFVPVLVTFRAKSSVHGAPILMKYRGRVRVFNAGYNEKVRIEDAGWRFFKRRFAGEKAPSIVFRSSGLELDYAPCFLKAVSNELNSVIGFRYAARQLGLGRPIYLGRWLSPDFQEYRPGGAAILAGLRQWLGEVGEALEYLGFEAVRLARALGRSRRDARGIRSVWFGIGTNEYGELGKTRSFYWPDRLGRDLGILYILPRAPGKEFSAKLEEAGVRWISQYDVLQYCPKGRLALLAAKLAWTACSIVIPWRGSLRWRARLCGLHFEALVWAAFAEAVPVKLAMTSSSNWRSTRPILLVLKQAGAKTALWYYAANAVRFQHAGGNRNANGRFKAFHEAERIYVWSPHCAKWTHRNLCHSPANEMRVVGPVMCGDARLCQRPPHESDGRIRVAVFDVTMPAGGSDSYFGALNLPENYYQVFWADMARLVRDVPEVVLVLKPKKSFKSPRRTFSDEFWKLFNDEHLKNAGRIEFVDSEADPYEAVARCHVAIGMPFTSPCQAALHFGRSGIYYDPTGVVGIHHYDDLGRFFCRSYGELASLVQGIAAIRREGGALPKPERAETFVGRELAGDPQATLVEDLREWIADRASLPTEHVSGTLRFNIHEEAVVR